MAQILLDGVEKRFPDGTMAVRGIDLTIADGEFMVLVGPSGCGKSTILRMIAGLEGATAGRILVGERDVTGQPPAERDVAMVFQNYALYPHMTVRENLGFSLKVNRVPKTEIAKRVESVAQMLGLNEQLARRPAQLSGGQRQRVAMGRAIVREPTAYLMDEPLSNLDAKLRVSMRAELAGLHERLGVTTVYVTHDQVEAMTLGQRVTVIDSGTLQQVGNPQQIYQTPANVFVASFIGSPSMNLVEAVVDDGTIVLGQHVMPISPQHRTALGDKTRVIVGMRPEHFGQLTDATQQLLHVEVETVEHLGAESHVFFTVNAPSTPLLQSGRHETDSARTRFVARLGGGVGSVGEALDLSVDTGRFHYFDSTTGASLLT